MAIVRFTGNALNRKQIDQYTIGGTPVAGTTVITITMNGKGFTYTAGSAVPATEAAALVAAIQAQTDIKEMLDFLASANGAIVVLTSNNAGVPFTVSSVGITGGGTFSGSTTTANSGSAVWSTATNWTSTPANGDDLVLDIPNVNIKYLLAGITATIATLTVRGTFNGELGNPIVNPLGYPEYRDCYCNSKAPILTIGLGDGTGPSRCYVNTDAGAATTVTVYKTGSSRDQYPAVMLKHTAGGSNSFGSVRVVDGSVGIALLPEETATVTLLTVGGDGTSPTVLLGVGAATTTFKAESGTTRFVASPSGTSTITGGATVYIGNGGDAAAINLDNGTLYFGGNGTASVITALTIGEAGTLDLSGGLGNVTVTDGIVIYAGARIIDPLGRLVTGTVFKPQNGVLSDFTYSGPPGKTWTMS